MILGFGGILPFLGVIPAIIAERRGRRGFLWWIYGTTLFVFALPHALMLEDAFDPDDDPEFRNCPFCIRAIAFEAKACRYCKRDVPPAERLDETASTKFLIETLASTDLDDRERAIIILGDRGPPERDAIPVLEALRRDPSRKIRVRAEWALQRLTGTFGFRSRRSSSPSRWP